MGIERAAQQAYLWACERLYHEFAWTYDGVSRLVSAGMWPAWRRLALAEVRGERVLEIGFGTGELLAEITQRWPQAVGLELSPAMQRVASRNLAGQGVDPGRVEAPAQAMPFADASFDTVLATFPAPYIFQPATLSEVARVLRVGGRFVVAGLWVRVRSEGFWRAIPVFYGDPTPVQFDTVAQHVAKAGFAVEWRMHSHAWAEVPVLIAVRVK